MKIIVNFLNFTILLSNILIKVFLKNLIRMKKNKNHFFQMSLTIVIFKRQLKFLNKKLYNKLLIKKLDKLNP